MKAGTLLAVVVGLCIIEPTAMGSEPPTPRKIGSRRQLFIDDYLIASMHGLKRSFHAATKHPEPVMVPAHPWEGVGTADWPSVYMHSGDVIFDEQKKLYRMWYSTATKDMNFQHDMLYATSTDGVHWNKPLDLNIVKYDGSGANNIVVRGCGPQNVLRMDQEPDPNKRYQLFSFDRTVSPNNAGGSYAWRYSADGLHWSDPDVIPAFRSWYDFGNVAYDETRGIYALVVKSKHDANYRHPVLGKDPDVGFRRWHMTTSRDRMNWTKPVELLSDFDEIDKRLYMEGEGCAMLNSYGLSLFSYHGVYLGIQYLFRIADPGGFLNLEGGPMDGRLLFTRDFTEPWLIPSREFAIPRGRKGEFDWGMIVSVTNRPALSPDGDQWYYYYGGWEYGHGTSKRRACIGLAKFRVDGFISIDSVGTRGILETPALTFAGAKLKVNVNATGENTVGEKNYVRVELLDADGDVIDGYARGDCDPIHADDVNHTVTWKGDSDVSSLAGDVIRIKFYIKGAELYAMQFVP